MLKKDHDNGKIPKELLKKIRKMAIVSKVLVTEAISGGYTSVFRGYGMEFEEVREYFPGDDYRRIDWNVTARHATPYVKRFREERQLNVMLLIDASASLQYGSLEQTKGEKLAETAAMIAFTALENQDKIGSIFFTDRIEKYLLPSKNKNSILRLIREILYIRPEGKGTSINTALDYAIENMKRRGIIFILSDFYSDLDIKKFFVARKKHDIIPVIFSDPFENQPVDVGLVDMIDIETGKLRLVDTSSLSYIRSVKDRKNKRDFFLSELNKLNIDPLYIETGDSIEQKLVSYFEKRRKKIR